MKKVLLFTLIAVFFASCSSDSEHKFDLEVNIQKNDSLKNKKFVINQMIDGTVVYADTFKIKKDRFLLELPYNGPGLINVSIPGTEIRGIMMVAERGKIQLNIEGVKPHISGTTLNDRLQAFHQGTDSVSSLFKQLEQEYLSLKNSGNPITPEMKEEFRQKRIQIRIENTDRMIAFIRENVDNPVGEYFFMTNYITFPIEKKLEMHSFATEKLKKEFRIQ